MSFPVLDLKVSLVGECGVGKTSFVNQSLIGSNDPTLVSTPGVDYKAELFNAIGSSDKLTNITVMVLDIGGRLKPGHKLVVDNLKSAHTIVFVFDLSNKDTFTALEQRYKDVVELRKGDQVATFLIGNKSDLPRVVSHIDAKSWAENRGMGYAEVCSKTGDNCKATFVSIVRKTLGSVSAGSEYTLKEGAAQVTSWGPYIWGTALVAGIAAGAVTILKQKNYF